MSDTITVMAVGDVFIDRPQPATELAPLGALFRRGDIIFGNCEGAYSAAPDRMPHSRGPQVASPGNAKALGELGFSVMSLANNHILDGGYEGLRQTITALHSQGIQTAGAAGDLAGAFAPAILARSGGTVAFVAVSSVFPAGYEARAAIAGLAPLRAHTFYLNPDPSMWNPGAPPQIITAIDDDDSRLAEAAVQQAAERADYVIVSIHWGDPFRPLGLTEHEMQAAQLLADAGATIVLGHHQHSLRSVSMIDGTPVFYGLGHVACDLPRLAEDLARESSDLDYRDEAACARLLGEFGIYPRGGYPLLPFHPDTRRTVVARCDLAPGGAVTAGAYPCRIGPDGAAAPLRTGDPQGDADFSYLQQCLATDPRAARATTEDDDGLIFWRFHEG